MTSINYSLELEQRVLETLMHFGDHKRLEVQKGFLKLNGDCFYNQDNKALFGIIRNCFNYQESFGFVDVLVLLPKENKELYDSLAWIIDNYGKFPSGVSKFENDVIRLITLRNLRKQVIIAENMISQVKNCSNPEESQAILIENINQISGLSYQQTNSGISNIEIADSFYEGSFVQDMKIPTNCDPLNLCLNGGIMPKSLIIVAAGASVGKTGFSIFLLDAIARTQPDTESLFFSLEMEHKHIWMRHVGICAGKNFEKLTEDERTIAILKSIEVPIKIYDTNICPSCLDIDFIVKTSRLKAMEKPISVIVVDYLGLVQNKGQFERNDLKQSDITSKLAQLAIELNCTVIALSQINRGASNRANDDRCPWPHDAADSSGGHRSAALWLGVDRPELYQEDASYKNQFVVKCRKNRFGTTFDLIFAFNDGTFAEIKPGFFKQPSTYAKDKGKALFSSHSKDFNET